MCKHREANPINRPEISEYRMLGKRHCGATEQSEELYVHNVYYSVLTGIDQSGSPFSSKFLPPSFLSLTLCIFSIFNKVLSVVTTCACAGGGFWYFFLKSALHYVYAVIFNSEQILFTFHNNMLHSCNREQKTCRHPQNRI